MTPLSLAQVLDAHPDLSLQGFDNPGRPGFVADRASLIAAQDQFDRAVAWLAMLPRRKVVNDEIGGQLPSETYLRKRNGQLRGERRVDRRCARAAPTYKDLRPVRAARCRVRGPLATGRAPQALADIRVSAGVTVLMVLILYCLHFPRATTHTYFTYLFTPVANREVTGKSGDSTKSRPSRPSRPRHWSTIRRAPLSMRCTIGPQSAQYRQHQFR